jgi:hypothetical protein
MWENDNKPRCKEPIRLILCTRYAVDVDAAADAKIFPFDQFPTKMAFDHARILRDYLRSAFYHE